MQLIISGVDEKPVITRGTLFKIMKLNNEILRKY